MVTLISVLDAVETVDEVEITFDQGSRVLTVHRHPKWSFDFAHRFLTAIDLKRFERQNADDRTIQEIRRKMAGELSQLALTRSIVKYHDGFWYHDLAEDRMRTRSVRGTHECGGPLRRCQCCQVIDFDDKMTGGKEPTW